MLNVRSSFKFEGFFSNQTYVLSVYNELLLHIKICVSTDTHKYKRSFLGVRCVHIYFELRVFRILKLKISRLKCLHVLNRVPSPDAS